MEENFVTTRKEDLQIYMAQLLQVPHLTDVEPFMSFIKETTDNPHYSYKSGYYTRGAETPKPSPQPSPEAQKRTLISDKDEMAEEEKDVVDEMAELGDSILEAAGFSPGQVTRRLSQASDGVNEILEEVQRRLSDSSTSTYSGDDSTGVADSVPSEIGGEEMEGSEDTECRNRKGSKDVAAKDITAVKDTAAEKDTAAATAERSGR
jgi:hypothetical protein